MKKKLMTTVSAFVMALSMSVCAFAGTWQQDTAGWKWQRDDGSYPAGGWEWLDDNGDGMEECYYFDPDGYCLIDNVTPDGYTVNADGAWAVDGIIQMRSASTALNGTRQVLLPLPNGEPMKFSITGNITIWSENITLLPDGTFFGNYINHSPDYNEHHYEINFGGKFNNIRKIDDYLYAMTVESWINDDGTSPSFETDTILYLPGAVVNDPTEFIVRLAGDVAGTETAKAIEEGRPINTYALRIDDNMYFQYDY